jgi:hypothetical protein
MTRIADRGRRRTRIAPVLRSTATGRRKAISATVHTITRRFVANEACLT